MLEKWGEEIEKILGGAVVGAQGQAPPLPETARDLVRGVREQAIDQMQEVAANPHRVPDRGHLVLKSSDEGLQV
jgi:hypothetical protein